MGKILVDKYTAEQVIQWYKDGMEVSYRIKDGDSLYFRTTIAKVKTKVKKDNNKKFRLGDGDDKTFEEYTDIVIDTANRRHVKVGTKNDPSRKVEMGGDYIVPFSEFDAYAKEFGIDNLKLKSDISIKQDEEI
jgi:hypothetical protein